MKIFNKNEPTYKNQDLIEKIEVKVTPSENTKRKKDYWKKFKKFSKFIFSFNRFSTTKLKNEKDISNLIDKWENNVYDNYIKKFKTEDFIKKDVEFKIEKNNILDQILLLEKIKKLILL